MTLGWCPVSMSALRVIHRGEEGAGALMRVLGTSARLGFY